MVEAVRVTVALGPLDGHGWPGCNARCVCGQEGPMALVTHLLVRIVSHDRKPRSNQVPDDVGGWEECPETHIQTYGGHLFQLYEERLLVVVWGLHCLSHESTPLRHKLQDTVTVKMFHSAGQELGVKVLLTVQRRIQNTSTLHLDASAFVAEDEPGQTIEETVTVPCGQDAVVVILLLVRDRHEGLGQFVRIVPIESRELVFLSIRRVWDGRNVLHSQLLHVLHVVCSVRILRSFTYPGNFLPSVWLGMTVVTVLVVLTEGSDTLAATVLCVAGLAPFVWVTLPADRDARVVFA